MSNSRKRDRAVISTALNVGMEFGEQKSADSIEELQSRIEELEARHDTQAHHYGTKIRQLQREHDLLLIAANHWQDKCEAGLKLANNPEWQGCTEYVRADKLREALNVKLNPKED